MSSISAAAGRKKRFPARAFMIFIYLLILVAGVLIVLYFGTQKQGFHEDELYSCYSSNRTAGIAWPDREWMDTQRLTDEMVVLPGEGFRYGLIRTVQSWDVHPPLYYDLLHTVCSLFPGVFSKWLGIGVNLVAYVLCFFLLTAICGQCGFSDHFTAWFLALWAFHPLTVSAAMFIRMYLWLTVFVLACLFLHLKLLTGFTKRRMAGVMLISFLGFLTHYYYLVFFFFTGVTLSLLWFLQKTEDTKATDVSFRVGRIARYGACCAGALAAAVLWYPASLAHIFRGYRGREAAEALLSPVGWGGRLAFFGGLINEYLFSGALGALLLLYAVLAVCGGRAERKLRADAALLLVPTVGYFLVVSTSALLLGASSNRYLMPVDPLIFLLVLLAGDALLKRMARRRSALRSCLFALFAGLFLFIDLSGLFRSDHVLFLYRENEAAIETARTHRDIPVIILYNEETPENIWRLYDRLVEFPRVYFVNPADGKPAGERIFEESDEIYVFAADTADNIDRDARIADLMRANPRMKEKEVLYRDAMWTWYRLGE